MSNKPQAITETIVLKDGREVTIETGKLAKQADGAVVVKMGGTMLLATVVAAKDANPGVDFLPLTVDYREKFSAAGRVPGNFFRRESKPSDDEVLTMRLVDRVMRPLFPEDFHAEVQVMISLISYDGKVMPDSLAGLAASAAVAITDIPFNGPFSEVRVIKKDGVLSINPSWETLQSGVELDIMVGASKDSIVMVEGEMDEITEQEMIEAISFAHEEIKIQIEAQERLAARIEKAQTKREYCHETHDEELRKEIWDYAYQRYYDIAKDPSAKHERSDKFSAVVDEFLEKYTLNFFGNAIDYTKTLDNGNIRYLLNYGIFAAILFAIISYSNIKKSIKNKNIYITIYMLIFLIYMMSEQSIFYIHFNIFLLYIFTETGNKDKRIESNA